MNSLSQEYNTLHKWIVAAFGSPNQCELCGNTRGGKRLEWANKSGRYLKSRHDWEQLCSLCHRQKDKLGKPLPALRLGDHCKNNHLIEKVGVYLVKEGGGLRKRCKACAADRQRRYLATKYKDNLS